MQLTRIFNEFFESERSGGMLLIACTAISLLLVNSPIGEHYQHVWHLEIAGNSLTHWINDLLMAVFFLLVGLEIEREIYIGELKSMRKAIFPILAAVGGMLVPALLYIGFNYATGDVSGFGIPMATDIAFAIGILSLLGSRIPVALKVFLTALAIIDDLGAICVIAIFYSAEIQWWYLLAAVSLFIGMVVMNRLKYMRLWLYIIPGVLMWYCMLQSGIHATISGVLLAFAIPFRQGDEASPSYRLQHILHKPVAFIILPLFALANTAVLLEPTLFDQLSSPHALGIFVGLVIGKPVGILLLTFVAVKSKIAELPEGVNWSHIFGASLLAGIGFTMSIFISLLAFEEESTIMLSKLAILISSVAAALLGLLYLHFATRKQGLL